METLLASVPWWQTTIVQAFGFIILFAVLGYFVGPVIKRILNVRQKGFADTFDRLDEDERLSSKRLTEVKQDLDQKEAEGERRIMKALEEGAQAKENALTDAKKQTKSILDRASRDVDIERDKAILELRTEITNLTLRASREVASKVVTPDVQANLVKKYLNDLEEVQS